MQENNIFELYNRTERKLLLQYGFFIHSIKNDEFINYHTHGLPEMKNHPDLQITLNIGAALAFEIFDIFIAQINNGKFFEPDTIITDLADMPFKLIEATESKRNVLRIMLPDPTGKFPEDEGCSFDFIMQNFVE